MKKLQNNPELSIIILTYNSQKELPVLLDSIYLFDQEKFSAHQWEIIIVDNNSSDGTVTWLKENKDKYPNLVLIENKGNLGFGPGNNVGARKSNGQYVLFLNPDMKVEKESISTPLDFLKLHSEVGAVTAKTILGNGSLDSTCHRGFPTPWNAFCYFSGLTRLFPKSKLFAGYTLGDLDLDVPHQVEAINGAYFMLPRKLGNELEWFDEDYFWKGEDLDLCYRMKQKGYQIWYLPQVKVWHYKGSSKGHQRGSKSLNARFEVMRLFYEKHYKDKYPGWVRHLVLAGIQLRYFLANLGI